MLSSKRVAQAKAHRGSLPRHRIASVRTQALFGWGQKDSSKDQEKEEAWRAQQELLAKRRTGEAIKEAAARRAAVKATVEERKAQRKQERDLLAQGIMPETLKDWKKTSAISLLRAETANS